METSISELIDKLSIINIKIFKCVEIIEHESNDQVVAEAARKAQLLNKQRSHIKNEIDLLLGKCDINDLDIKLSTDHPTAGGDCN